MQRASQVSSEIRQAVYDQKIDLLLVQEPYAFQERNKSEWILPQFKKFKIAKISSGRPWAAIVATNQDPNFEILCISQLCTSHCVCVEVRAPGGSFYAVSCYFQHKDEIEPHLNHLEKVVIALRGKRVIFALDANAESPMWGAESTGDGGRGRERTERGKILEDFILSHGLAVANCGEHEPTYETARGKSFIDVTLVSPSMESMISQWNVRGNWCGSDHKAISIGISAAPERGHEGGESAVLARFDVRRADWDRFSEVFQGKAARTLRDFSLESAEDVEEAARRLVGIITEACEAAMPRRRHRVRPNPWWTPQLSKMRIKVANARHRLFRVRNNPTLKSIRKQEWSKLTRKYQSMMFKARQKSWRKFVSGHGNEEPWGVVYKLSADKLLARTVISTVRCTGGRETMGMQETAKHLLDVHVPDDDPSQDSPEQAAIRAEVRQMQLDTEVAEPFDVEMVRKAVRSMRNGKAPGPDLIEVEVLKGALKANSEIFLKVFNACLIHSVFPKVWKVGKMITFLKGRDKDPSDPKSYRPICLLSVIGKLLEKLIKLRLEESVLTRISDRQYGFRPGRSCEDAINDMREKVASSDAKYTVGLLFDIQGAFDNVWWPLVLKNLADLGCQVNIFKLMCSYFSDREVFIHWGREFVSKIATRGCPQGSVLGPDCWNIMFDSIIKAAEELSAQNPNILPSTNYADDRLRIIKGESREGLKKDLQQEVDKFVSLCAAAKLTVSEKKTEAIFLKHSQPPVKTVKFNRPDRKRKAKTTHTLSTHPPEIKIGHNTIKFKKTVRYLGVHFDTDLKVHSHVAHIREKILKLFGKLRRMAGATWGLRFGTLRTIFRGALLPTVTYAASGWSDRCLSSDWGSLRATHRQALIVTTGAYRTISYTAACVAAGMLPVELLLEQSCARYAVRVGRPGRIGDLEVDPTSADAVRDIKKKAIELWEAQYAASVAERTLGPPIISTFFPKIIDRLQSDWVRPNHYVTQVLSGHGRFNSFLASRKIVASGECSCGAELDTVQHFVMDCPEFARQRVALLEKIEGKEWPEVARLFVSSPEAFKLLNAFCCECLWMRESESRCVY